MYKDIPVVMFIVSLVQIVFVYILVAIKSRWMVTTVQKRNKVISDLYYDDWLFV